MSHFVDFTPYVDAQRCRRADFATLDAIDEVINSMSELRSQWRFIAVGGGREVERVREAIRDFEIKTGVKLCRSE